MRGAGIMILSLMLSLIRFRRVGGSVGELKIHSERVQKTGKKGVEEEHEIIRPQQYGHK